MGRATSHSSSPAAAEQPGCSKLLLPWGQKTIIEQVLEAWRVGGVDEPIVVVRADDAALLAVCHRAGATVCIPNEPPPEMIDSVAAGLALVAERFAPAAGDAWLVAPADLPELSPRLIRRLLETYRGEAGQILVPRLADGRTGHPVLYSWDLAVEVASHVEWDQQREVPPGTEITVGLRFAGPALRTLRDLQGRHLVKFVEWTDADSFADIDTPHDYQNRHNRTRRQAE